MSDPAPSLLQRGREQFDGGYAPMWRWIGIVALGIALALAGIVIGAELRARKLAAATAGLSSPETYAARHEAAAVAALFGQPTLPSILTQMAAHLPPATAVSRVGLDGAGIPRIVIETDDPDMLRAAFKDDRWLAQFRQRAEDQIGDGRFRLTFEMRR